MSFQPWHELPREIVTVLRPELVDTAEEMIEAVRAVPAYARPLEGEFGEGLRAGVEQALHHLLAEIEAGGPVARSDVYTLLGRGEMRAGRSLESLLSAYRAGARVAWRRFAAAGSRAGLEPATMYLLAEAIFAYIDMLSVESAEGHALEQSAAASEAERLRRRLVRLLVREPAPDPELVQAAAGEAGWPLPRTVAAVAIAGARREAAVAHLPQGTITDTIGGITCAILPDPDGPGRHSALRHAVVQAGVQAGLGTTVGWVEAAISFARARGALALGDGSPSLTAAREKAGELLLASEPRLAAELAAVRLAPLGGLSAGSRTRLTQTLRVWLAEQGRLGQVAVRLSVHPQTARYRLARLRELFGPALDDPDERFWLEVALRVSDVPAG
jgi:PucR C-terminal helix-turn-helix domain